MTSLHIKALMKRKQIMNRHPVRSQARSTGQFGEKLKLSESFHGGLWSSVAHLPVFFLFCSSNSPAVHSVLTVRMGG